MTITISEFTLGVLTTLGVEIGAFILTIIYYAIKSSLKSRRNASNSSRSDKNE
jgi:hypothetical protein